MAIAFGMFSALAVPSRALILFGTPAGHDSDPGNGMPWQNVGTLNGLTGIYLGAFSNGYWVITANHVGAGTITLAGQNYAPVPGSAQQVGTADLLVFRLASEPALPSLNLPTSSPAFLSPVWMVGNGGGTKNWGTNQVDFTTGPVVLSGTTTDAFATKYGTVTNATTAAGEAQGTTGDSGGAVFFQSNGNWMLGGVLFAVGTPAGSPPITLASDLSLYRTQIGTFTGTAIPEPATWASILGLGALVAAAYRRRTFFGWSRFFRPKP